MPKEHDIRVCHVRREYKWKWFTRLGRRHYVLAELGSRSSGRTATVVYIPVHTQRKAEVVLFKIGAAIKLGSNLTRNKAEPNKFVRHSSHSSPVLDPLDK